MDKNNASCQRMLHLREPKRKKRSRIKPNAPFPINIGPENKWIMYTGHLSSLGVCVIESCEIEALHSMGFFGKGALSRSFPNFEKSKTGVHTILRERQWKRRQTWLQQAQILKGLTDDFGEEEWGNIGQLDSEKESEQCQQGVGDTSIKDSKPEQRKDSKLEKNNQNIDPIKKPNPSSLESHKAIENPKSKVEVVLDASNEDEIYKISNTEKVGAVAFDVSNDVNTTLSDDEAMSIDLYKRLDETKNQLGCIDQKPAIQERDWMILPDSDSDSGDYLNTIKPSVEKEGFPIKEPLYLTFEETFFLMFGLGCLQVINYDGNMMNILEAWNHFCRVQHDFVQKYVVYHYFRSKGWVVKPGLKYGGDFLLYKQGPPFYHASYIVIVEVLNADTLLKDTKKMVRKMTWTKLASLDRLSETAAKEILFAQVLWPPEVSKDEISFSPEFLSEFTVNELLYRRWIPKQKREEIDLENDIELHE
ncbi:tRNA-splicing endonuclease subunit Sen2 [Athalia rosae]|uniref:tRNA-splicing endonuclease subunit Sen2 n=1 Tax=Athalia rosae TaxID=37344 RepID=UPI0020348EDD|nr:tRNA-splicing endonuclease subunit Sen2 [Athalia rosae]